MAASSHPRPAKGQFRVETLEDRNMPSVTVEFCGYVYQDLNCDGVKGDDEPGISGVPVEVRTADGGTVVAAGLTDENGCYKLSAPHLPAGAYTIVEVTQPAGFDDGQESLKTGTGNTPFPGTIGTDTIPVTVVDGQTVYCEYNFGEKPTPPPPPAPAKLGGFVYLDADDDGVFDAGERPIPGATVTLERMTGTGLVFVASTSTGADGSYCFPDLPAGTYKLTEAQPAGFADGKDTAGTVTGGEPGAANGSVTANDMIAGVVLTPGGTGANYNFGERPLPPPPPGEVTGREGLTPGFWKSNATKHGASAWGPTGYFQFQTLGSVFDFAGTRFQSYANVTLVQALSLNGGGVNALLRSAVAAVLNAAHPQVDYPLTTAQIVARVNAALASGDAGQIEALKNQLDGFNNLGADLNQQGR